MMCTVGGGGQLRRRATTGTQRADDPVRIGIDVGGTFTDAVGIDARGSIVGHHKLESTPPHVDEGAVAALEALAFDREVELVVHGTTIATNALLERKVARTGLLTTAGFRDVLAIGTQMRPDLYDVRQVKPTPLVPRHLRLEAAERITPDGSVLRELDEASVERAARRFRREGVQAVAVCFLFSYVSPSHERRAAEILSRQGFDVACSSEVAPMMREYPRTSTTVMNAALRPMLARYLGGLEERAGAPVLVLQSGGGVIPASEAANRGHELLVSGPAGGVVGASAYAAATKITDLVTMDMGGTSFDTCLVTDGRPAVRGESVLGGEPILAASIDLETVGAGGGSVAHVDSGGALRVGPMSAGADPGPACYGHGGGHATVTDANLVLGRLDHERFLGGRVRLHPDAAARAIHDTIARPLDLSIEEAAEAIVEIASSTMARALRLVTVGRGRDPAVLPLVAFGGAGPMHAVDLADELGSPRVLVPPYPGFVSAIGMLATDLRTEIAETVLGRGEVGPVALAAASRRMTRVATARLGTDPGKTVVTLALDCRYRGQGFELPVPLGAPTAAGLVAARQRFHAVHDAVYGHSAPAEPVEVVALRVTASARGAGFEPAPNTTRRQTPPVDTRKVYAGGSWIEARVVDRASIGSAWWANGPLLVVEDEATTWVPSGWRVGTDSIGTLEVVRD